LENSGLVVRYSDIEDGLDSIIIIGNSWVDWMEGNIDEDPLLFQSGEHPFSITEDSPCIDKGTPDTTGLNLPFWDIIGNDRIVDGDGDEVAVVDMGAYEFSGGYVGNYSDELLITNYELQVYPNPCSRAARLRYQIPDPPEGGHGTRYLISDLYSISGKKIKRLLNEEKQPGMHGIEIDVSNLPNGIYLLRLQAGSHVVTTKFVVMR